MERGRSGRAIDQGTNVSEKLRELRIAQGGGERMNARWNNALADHHLQPAGLGEKLFMLTINAARRAEEIELGLQRRRHGHFAPLDPEGGVRPLIRVVMENDEIADALEFEARLAIEFIDQRRIKMPDWMRWIEVDSSGSRKPLASPSETQFFTH